MNIRDLFLYVSFGISCGIFGYAMGLDRGYEENDNYIQNYREIIQKQDSSIEKLLNQQSRLINTLRENNSRNSEIRELNKEESEINKKLKDLEKELDKISK